MRIAIQGYEGCFHQIVAEEYFGRGVEILPCATFRRVAEAVKQGEADYGVMAIENSIAGSIIANYQILQDENLQVEGEYYLPIEQNLMVLPDVELEDIRELIDSAIIEDPPFSVREGGMIKDGYYPELDELRSILNGGKDILARIELEEIAQKKIFLNIAEN